MTTLSESPWVSKKRGFGLAVVLAVSLGIYFLGPYVTIGGHAILAAGHYRALFISFLFAAWLLQGNLAFGRINKTEEEMLGTNNIAADLDGLQGRLHGAIQFLKKAKLNPKDKSLFQLPWFLVLGPRDAGKSSLFVHSGLNYVLAKQRQQNTSTKYCDWWVTREAVILDVAGDFITQPQYKFRLLWNRFLSILHKQLAPEALQGVLLVVSYPHLIRLNVTERQTLFKQFQERLVELNRQVSRRLKIMILISQADHIEGFSEYYSELEPDDRYKPCGISFDEAASTQAGAHFKTQFSEFIAQLDNRLLWRLHKESDLDKRNFIADFPRQLEKIQDFLEDFVAHLEAVLAPERNNQLAGVYLTSSCQDEQVLETVLVSTPEGAALATLPTASMKAQSKPFFIYQLLADMLPNQLINTTPDPRHLLRLKISQTLSYWSATLLIVVAGVYGAMTYKGKFDRINALEQSLSRYEALSDLPAEITTTLHALRELRQTTVLLDGVKLPLLFGLTPKSEKQLKELARADLTKVISYQLLPVLRDAAARQIKKKDLSLSAEYLALKAYLMLGGDVTMNLNYLSHWLVASKAIEPAVLQEAMQFLSSADSASYVYPELDHHLIGRLRAQLFNRSPEELALIVWQAQAHLSELPDLVLPPLFANKIITIPAMYTATGLMRLTPLELKNAAEAACNGDSVLGTPPRVVDKSAVKVIRAIATEYDKQYINIWQKVLATVKVPAADHIETAQRWIQNLLRPENPLQFWITALRENTQFPNIGQTHQIINPIRIAFRELRTLALPPYSLQPAFTEILQLLQTVESSNDPALTAYQIASRRMSLTMPDSLDQLWNMGSQLPRPVGTWLQQVSQASWKLLLEESMNYLNPRWKEEVWGTYQQNLAGRFPLAKESDREVELQYFTDFFSPQGVVARFFNQYLSPFIDTRQYPWAVKTRNGLGLEMTTQTLAQLEQSAAITHMFFSRDPKQPNINFHLIPIALGSTVNRFSLYLNGQQVDYAANDIPQSVALRWPEAEGDIYTSVKMTGYDGHAHKETLYGTWAWFRLLEQAQLESTTDLKRYALTFNVEGNPVQYELVAASDLNPFIPNLFHSFGIIETLSSSAKATS